MYAYIKQPAYLRRVALKAIQRLTFKIVTTQFSSSSSLRLLKKQIVPRQSPRESGSIHPQIISEDDSCSPLFITLNRMSIFDPFPKFYFFMVIPQSLMTKLKPVQDLISYLNRDWQEKLFPQYQIISRTDYLLALVFSQSTVQLVTLHFFKDQTGHIQAGMRASWRLKEASCRISFAVNLILISIYKVPGWMVIRSRKIHPPYRLKLVKERLLEITFPSIYARVMNSTRSKMVYFLFIMVLIILVCLDMILLGSGRIKLPRALELLVDLLEEVAAWHRGSGGGYLLVLRVGVGVDWKCLDFSGEGLGGFIDGSDLGLNDGVFVELGFE